MSWGVNIRGCPPLKVRVGGTGIWNVGNGEAVRQVEYVLEKVNKVMSSEWHTKLSEGWGNDPQRSFELSLVGQKRHGGLSLKASSTRSGLIF